LDQDNLDAVAGFWLIVPLARGVMDDGDTAELTFRLGPDGCSRHASGPTYVVAHKAQRSGVSPARFCT